MLIHFPEALIDLNEFGITVPLLTQRYWKTLEHLQSHPRLGPSVKSWLREVNLPVPSRADLELCHCRTYLDVLLSNNPFEAVAEAYELWMPNPDSPGTYDAAKALLPLGDLVRKSLLQVSGTQLACREALEGGFAYFLGGGLHHAMSHAGRGFCLVHDVMISIRKLQREKRIETAWVVDVDAHRGDGTAELALGDSSVLNLSIHMANGWPIGEPPLTADKKLKPWFYPATVDIGIPCGQEHAYVELLANGLRQMEVAAGGRMPDLVVVVSGSDPFEGDVLPSATLLKMSQEQMFARDKLVFDWFAFRGVPQAYVMAGGYGPDNWRVHATFLEYALERTHHLPSQ